MELELSERIENQTLSQVRSFLDELANGTRNYRSLHNLTQQIEHQYHGRFLIELLQNAHDAISLAEGDIVSRRVAVALVPGEGGFGTLYVANDGRAFTESDFEAVASLGQSDKDPNRCVGNKGIGFRSVLEISDSPEIYSGASTETGQFTGYCFGFDTGFVTALVDKVLSLLREHAIPCLTFSGREHQLVDWSSERLDRFRERWRKSEEHLEREIHYLSPYLLPLPRRDSSVRISEFARDGYSTVVRLPLKSQEAYESSHACIKSIASQDLLFLHEIEQLRLVTDQGGTLFRRAVDAGPNMAGGQMVQIDDGSESKASYLLWSQTIGGPKDDEGALELAEAASGLPGRWPELREAQLSVAVRVDDEPAHGVLSIFLPTEQATGTAAHLNAPFFGEMSRTAVDLDEPLNRLLLTRIGRLIATIVSEIAGKAPAVAGAVIDLLAPVGTKTTVRARLIETIVGVLEEAEHDLSDIEMFLTDGGWRSAAAVRCIPDRQDSVVLTSDCIRRLAQFPLLVPALESRAELASELVSELGGDPDPTTDELADTIEGVAKDLFAEFGRQGAWPAFWKEVQGLIPARSHLPHPLLEKRVLLSDDGRLVAPGGSRGQQRVFSLPRDSAGDSTSPSPTEIPRSLRRRIAFLASEIPLAVRDRGKLSKTENADYLRAGDPPLVHEFRREDLLREVLVAATPKANVGLQSPEAARCRAIIQWALRLVLSARDPQNLSPLLSALRVPCRGGWLRPDLALFGQGWHGTNGEPISELADQLAQRDDSSLADRVLLPPGEWASDFHQQGLVTALRSAGVIDGLPLDAAPESWPSSFFMNSWQKPKLPEVAPPCVSDPAWSEYCEHIASELEPHFQGEFEYRMSPPVSFPGISHLSSFPADVRERLAQIIAASTGGWDESFSSARASKVGGQYDSQSFESLVHFVLRTRPWLPVDGDAEPAEFRPPCEVWFVPFADLQGRRHQFAHLTLLDSEISRQLEDDPKAADVLEELGLNRFPKEDEQCDARLLDSLGRALEEEKVTEANRDVFLGHVRHAWRCLGANSPEELPSRFIVRQGKAGLSVIGDENAVAVYLPDARAETGAMLSGADLPTLEIELAEARRLRDVLVQAPGVQFRPLSLAEARVSLSPKLDSSESLPLVVDTAVSWLPIFALTVAAFFGDRSHGSETRRFRDAVGRLRTVQIFECTSISFSYLWDDEEVLGREVRAAWLREPNVLCVARPIEDNLESLAAPLEEMLARNDLLVPLRLALSKLPPNSLPSRQERLEALAALDVTASQLAEVEQRWLGDLDWVRERLRPVVLLLSPGTDSSLLTPSRDMEELQATLSELLPPAVAASRVLAIARASDSDAAVGKALFQWLGAQAELGKWNAALAAAGPSYLAITNQNVGKQLRIHIDSCRLAFLAVVREHVLATSEPRDFARLRDSIATVQAPDEVASAYWTLPFTAAMESVASVLRDEGFDSRFLESIERADTKASLEESLADLGLDVGVDPEETLALNLSNAGAIAETLHRVAVVHRDKQKLGLGPWGTQSAELAATACSELEAGIGYLTILDHEALFALVKASMREAADDAAFWREIGDCECVGDVQSRLDISDEEIRAASDTTENLKERDRRKKRLVKVCGRDFDGDPSNLKNLFSLLSDAVPEERIEPFDLDALVDLEATRSGKRRSRGGGGARNKPRARMSAAEKEVVGLAGEIFAFRALKRAFGASMSSASWVSENSRHVFPTNAVDDTLGYDFDVVVHGRRHLIEVKATVGQEEEFEMGPSQVERAIESRSDPDVRFLICRVFHALSDDPGFDLLPNPFEDEQRGRFSIQEAGMKVRYRKAENAEGE